MGQRQKALYRWRDLVLSKHGPPPTTRLVLLAIASHMNADGGGAFPGVRELIRQTGLSNRAVIDHVNAAVEAGWLTFEKRRGRKGWFRLYALALPPGVVSDVHHLGGEPTSPRSPEGGEGRSPRAGLGGERGSGGAEPRAEGGERRSVRVVSDVHLSSSGSSSKSNPSSSAVAHANGNGGTSTTADEGGHPEVVEAIRSRPAGLTRDQALRYATLGTDEERGAFLVSIGYRE